MSFPPRARMVAVYCSFLKTLEGDKVCLTCNIISPGNEKEFPIPKHHLISNCDTIPPGSLDFRWAVVCLPGGHKGGSGGLGGEEGGLDNNYTIVTFHSELGKITAFLPAVLTQR